MRGSWTTAALGFACQAPSMSASHTLPASEEQSTPAPQRLPEDSVGDLQRTPAGDFVGVGTHHFVHFRNRDGRVELLPFGNGDLSPALGYALNEYGSRAVIGFEDAIEVWSTSPIRRLSRIPARAVAQNVRAIGLSEDESTFYALGWCTDVERCGPRWTNFYRTDIGTWKAAYSGTGLPLASARTLSPTGHYLLHEAANGYFVIDTATGSTTLRRLAEDVRATRVARFDGSQLIIARDEMVEVDGLASGKTVRSHRYEVGSAPSHLLMTDEHAIVSFDPREGTLFRWRYLTDAPVERTEIPEARGCDTCVLRRDAGSVTLYQSGLQPTTSVQRVPVRVDLTTLHTAAMTHARHVTAQFGGLTLLEEQMTDRHIRCLVELGSGEKLELEGQLCPYDRPRPKVLETARPYVMVMVNPKWRGYYNAERSQRSLRVR
jgi:hypothetical protein